MTTFDDRERAFENRFAHDAELDFRAGARRDKLVGIWAAALLGKSGEDAERYARDVVHQHIVNKREEDLVAFLAHDLAGRADPAAIRSYMAAAMGTARHQIMTEVH